MVKIRDLTNPQLMQQIDKYQNIVTQLESERQRRVKVDSSQKELLSADELEKLNNVVEEESNPFQVSFDDDDFNEIDSIHEAEKKKAEPEEDDSVGMTQILKLTKEDLAKLKQESVNVKKKKKVKKKIKKISSS